MPNSDPDGRIFLTTAHNHDIFFFLNTFRFTKLILNIAPILLSEYGDVRHYVLTSRWHPNDANITIRNVTSSTAYAQITLDSLLLLSYPWVR